MRKIIVSAFVSLAGVTQAPGGPEEDTGGGFKPPSDLLLGRKTQDIHAVHGSRLAADSPPAAES